VENTHLTAVEYPGMKASKRFIRDLNPKVVLYPNQFYLNFSVWGYSKAFHVFVSHGESDKSYMSQNGLRYFDYVYVAGEVAANRIRTNIGTIEDSRLIPVGRPQLLDEFSPRPDEVPAADGRQIVLYAPTWEGGLFQNRYGSVLSHGEALVRSVLAHPDKFQLIYKPHPFTGSIFPDWAAANERIKALVESANAAGGVHYVDSSPFGWHLDYADFMITDVSAVAYDWLSTGKPLAITKPVEPRAEIYEDGILGAVDLIEVDEAGSIAERITAALGDESAQEFFSSWSSRYYASATSPETGRERFIEETLALVAAAEPREDLNNPTTRAIEIIGLGENLLRIAKRKILGRRAVKLKAALAKRITPRNIKPSVNLLALTKAVVSDELLSIAIARFTPTSANGKVRLVLNTRHNMMKFGLRWFTDPKFRALVDVHYAPTAQQVSNVVKSNGDSHVYYLGHGEANHFGIRLNGYTHVLFAPELQVRFKSDHNLIAYNEIWTNQVDPAKGIVKGVRNPGTFEFRPIGA
ncbi:MAG: hypothetical protein RLZZ587_869, partial [Actinomycetota bacterium]